MIDLATGARRQRTVEEWFAEYALPEPNGGCHIWLGTLDKNGYGVINAGPRKIFAHRAAYELYIGPIPVGLVLDHLCRVHCCVNELHLEAVTIAENVRRMPKSAHNCARKTHCKHGHPFAGDNLLVLGDGERSCRECGRARKARMLERRSAEARPC